MNNKRATKRALLTSVMALVMCVVMLVGTTFAWFTDTASTAVNKIQAGNLDVGLEMKAANGEWVSAEGKTLNFLQKQGDEAGKVPSADILWEPGCTYELEPVRIVNNGNLALKYKVEITGIEQGRTAVSDQPNLNDVITWTISYGDGTNKVASADGEYFLLPANTAGVELTISGTMSRDAGNKYQGLTLNGATITVLATQYTYEKDSKDDQYDKDAQYPDVNIVTVTPETIPSPFEANTVYFFEAGNYGERHFVITDRENVTLIGKTGAKFDSLQISSIDYVNSSIGQVVDLDSSTLTVKGFEVAKTLMIVEADKNVVVEDNTAAQITVKTNLSSQSIAVNNNIITGGDGAANGYGVYIVPNVTDYDLTVTGNSFTNVKSHAISVQGCGDGSAVTAAKSITVNGNTFTSYGTNGKTGRAAFKIWEDTKLAPNSTDPLNDAAKALAKSVNDNNHFATLDTNCVVADFYGKTVALTANP